MNNFICLYFADIATDVTRKYMIPFSVIKENCIFKQGNTILVDTPGIGANEEITQKLKEYLPNAVSFVFVINVANAGGMQKDRV